MKKSKIKDSVYIYPPSIDDIYGKGSNKGCLSIIISIIIFLLLTSY